METVVSQASHVSPALGLLQTLLMPSCGRRPSRILPWMRRRRDSWSIVASRVAAARECGRGDSSTERRPARDVDNALERGGVATGQGRVQEGAGAAERDPARGMV